MAKSQETPAQQAKTAWEQYLAQRGLQPGGEIIYRPTNVELENRNLAGSVGWLHSPAYLELYAKAYRQLLLVAKLRKLDVGQITKVDSARMADSEIVFLFPITDAEGVGQKLSKSNSHYWTNLRALLQPAKRLVEVGKKVKFQIDLLPDSPVGPTLVIDLSKVLEIRNTDKDDEEKADSEQGGTQKSRSAKAGGKKNGTDTQMTGTETQKGGTETQKAATDTQKAG